MDINDLVPIIHEYRSTDEPIYQDRNEIITLIDRTDFAWVTFRYIGHRYRIPVRLISGANTRTFKDPEIYMELMEPKNTSNGFEYFTKRKEEVKFLLHLSVITSVWPVYSFGSMRDLITRYIRECRALNFEYLSGDCVKAIPVDIFEDSSDQLSYISAVRTVDKVLTHIRIAALKRFNPLE